MECLQNMSLQQSCGHHTQGRLSPSGASDHLSPSHVHLQSSLELPTKQTWPWGVPPPLTLKPTAGKMDLIPQQLYIPASGNAWLTFLLPRAGKEDRTPGQDPPPQPHFLPCCFIAAVSCWKNEHAARCLYSLRKHLLDVINPSDALRNQGAFSSHLLFAGQWFYIPFCNLPLSQLMVKLYDQNLSLFLTCK